MQELYIDTPGKLDELSHQLRNCSWLALDTEFIREKTYFPRLCLLQIASDELIACVDPLALPNLNLLLDIIHEPSIVKIFHAGRQDLEILYYLTNTLPQPLFDTQIAAALLGYGDQIGYGALVEKMLGVKLSKAHSRTDWSLRPLEPDQLHYAADDVRYLGDLYKKQQQTLAELGRLEWLTDDFATLASPRTYQNIADNVWQRVRGHQHLKGIQLAILQTLAAWREKLARQLDKPRKWLLRDETLLELARRQPGNLQELGKIRSLETGFQHRYGDEILAAIRSARKQPPEQWPRAKRRNRLSPEQESTVDVMMALTRLIAMKNHISPASLTTRKELERMVSGEADTPVMQGWRAELCGNRLLAFLEGRIKLQMQHGHLTDTIIQDKTRIIRKVFSNP